MPLNLNAEQCKAHAHAYRNIHHTRLYRLQQRANGSHVLVVKFEDPNASGPALRVAKLSLRADTVAVEYFDADICPHYRDPEHLKACVLATLNAYKHSDAPLFEAFDIRCEDECSTSLPMVIPELLNA